MVNHVVEGQIEDGLRALKPPGVSGETIDMAISLSVRYARIKCKVMVGSVVKVEAKMKLDAKLQTLEKKMKLAGGVANAVENLSGLEKEVVVGSSGALKTLHKEVLERMVVVAKVIEGHVCQSSPIDRAMVVVSCSDLPYAIKNDIIRITLRLLQQHKDNDVVPNSSKSISSAIRNSNNCFDIVSSVTTRRFVNAVHSLFQYWFTTLLLLRGTNGDDDDSDDNSGTLTTIEHQQEYTTTTCYHPPSLFVLILRALAALGKTQIICHELSVIGTLVCSSANLTQMIRWDTYVYANGDGSGGCKDADSEDIEDEDEQIDIAECLASLVRGNIIGKVLLERALLQVMESFTLSQAVARRCLFLLGCVRRRRRRVASVECGGDDDDDGNEWTAAEDFVMPLLTLRLSRLDT